jgi:hypothetical protein
LSAPTWLVRSLMAFFRLSVVCSLNCVMLLYDCRDHPDNLHGDLAHAAA